ncbi:bleomycin resistance protein [Spirosoma montaniterrae]|uniref:Bleomycin resistance protein n=1 Tax=Spirosoma montaniterrae TaxID=1178516 RepID=A0A1P9WYG7_9BACT|nr:VOC family protein [Spirosoma montaniterrae]AQG80404.1 Bleomycin resistance protein [Spirosoma montaniterrae]
MLTATHPKLPMRDKAATKDFYLTKLGFTVFGNTDHANYLMVEKDGLQLHFFAHPDLDPAENYGQVYIRTNDIDALYASLPGGQTIVHPNDPLQLKPWGQKEFSVLDPDNNLLTFGQSF